MATFILPFPECKQSAVVLFYCRAAPVAGPYGDPIRQEPGEGRKGVLFSADELCSAVAGSPEMH